MELKLYQLGEREIVEASEENSNEHYYLASAADEAFGALTKQREADVIALNLKDAQLEEARKNERRYLWLRSEEVSADPRYYPFWQAVEPKLVREGRMDALIDKWMTMDFCEHDNDAATCGTCHGQFGVGA